MPTGPESSINALSIARGVSYHRASASSSSLSPLLNVNDWEDAGSVPTQNIMGSSFKDLERISSKTQAQEYSEDASPGSRYELSGFNLAEAEGRVGFWGLFDNTLV